MKCFLKPISGDLPVIELQDGKPRSIGRGQESDITNKRCSKKQGKKE